jgi:hypothetical protein
MEDKIKILKKLDDFCKKNGVLELEIDGIRLKYSDTPHKIKKSKKDEEIQEPSKLSDEDVLFWSSQQ